MSGAACAGTAAANPVTASALSRATALPCRFRPRVTIGLSPLVRCATQADVERPQAGKRCCLHHEQFCRLRLALGDLASKRKSTIRDGGHPRGTHRSHAPHADSTEGPVTGWTI